MGTRIEIDSYYANPLGYTRGLFAQTADSVPVTDLNLNGSLFGTGVGVLSVPADAFKVGDSFQLTIGGHFTCNNTSDLQIKVLSNGTIELANTGVLNLPQCTDQHWQLLITFTVRTLGIATVASIVSNGTFSYVKDSSSNFEGVDFSEVNTTTFDTTISNILDIRAIWTSTSGGELIFSELAVLNKIF